MQYINNEVYVNLENYLNIESLDSMHTEIIKTIAECSDNCVTSYTPQNTFYDNTVNSFLEERRKNKDNPELSNLTDRQLDWFTKLNSSVTLGTQLVVRGNRGYPATYRYKHLNEYSIDMAWAGKFDFLMDWVKEQDCFEEFGRTMFWINEPSQRTALHTDYGNFLSKRKDMFIWITGINPKKLIFRNEETDEETETNCRACLFNNNNWHGSKGHSKYTSWSFRVDGVFKKSWAEKAGLAQYFEL